MSEHDISEGKPDAFKYHVVFKMKSGNEVLMTLMLDEEKAENIDEFVMAWLSEDGAEGCGVMKIREGGRTTFVRKKDIETVVVYTLSTEG